MAGSERTSQTRNSVGMVTVWLISASSVSRSEAVRERQSIEAPVDDKARAVADASISN